MLFSVFIWPVLKWKKNKCTLSCISVIAGIQTWLKILFDGQENPSSVHIKDSSPDSMLGSNLCTWTDLWFSFLLLLEQILSFKKSRLNFGWAFLSRPRGYENFVMFNPAEHEIFCSQ